MRNMKPLACAALFAAMLSCSKEAIPENPEEKNFSGADFNVTVNETRCYLECSYPVSGDGSIGNGGHGDPVVTGWNTVTLALSSDDPSFDGANVSSSNTSAISVTRMDDRSYMLGYVGDGEADIRVWNTSREVRFRLSSRESVPLEGILMRVDGKEFTVRADNTMPSPFDKDSPYLWGPERVKEDMVYFSDLTDGRPYEIEIVDLVPSNTSWRGIARFMVVNTGSFSSDTSEWFTGAGSDDVIIEKNDMRDASSILGKKVLWVPDSNEEGTPFRSRFLIVTFKENFKDYSTPASEIRYSTVFCGRMTR